MSGRAFVIVAGLFASATTLALPFTFSAEPNATGLMVTETRAHGGTS